MKRSSTDPPVKVGDTIELNIEAQGAKGDGIAKIDGYVIFVPKAEIGKKYQVSVNRVFPNMGFAEIISDDAQTQDSEDEVEPEQPEMDVVDDTEDFGTDDEEKELD